MGGKGSECSNIGYRYYSGLHLVFCHGLDKLLKIKVGDKIAWEGNVSAATANVPIVINKPELFGGDTREGGIVGRVDACFGLPGQAPNSYLQSVLGAAIPAYRGLFGLVANHCQLSAMNPYIKEWSVLGERAETGWLDHLSGIVASDGYVDMNAAHIIREALTNTTWGTLGYPEADLDEASFVAAANLLHSGAGEGMGLALLWTEDVSVEEFLRTVLNHIDGLLFFSHVTGLLTLKLVRNHYTAGALPVLDPSNIIKLVEYAAPAATEAINQVTVNWVDRDDNLRATTVQDLAGISMANGQIIAATLDFAGIATEDWARKIAARELQQLCMPISSCTLVINRKHYDLEPGDPFVLNWPPVGITDMVMRVDSVDIGIHTEGELLIKAARDVYGFGPVAVTSPAESLWTDPISAPAVAVRRKLMELTWYQFVLQFGESEAVLAELDDASTLLTCFCARPSTDALNYEMWSRNTGAPDFVKSDTDSFPFAGTTAAALTPEISSVIALQEGTIDTNLVQVGSYAALGDELVAVTAIDPVAVTVTVDRGILDTIPVAHAAGEYLWFHQDLYGLDQTDRTVGESVEVRMLPSTSLGRLALADAATDTHVCAGRMMRPYPPGNVQVNGFRWPASIGILEQLSLTWSHRDRTLQTVSLNRQDEGDIGPELGVTYTLRIYGETDQLLRTETGLATTSYTYLQADEETDSGYVPARLNTSLRFELEAVRGGLTSLQRWNITVNRA